MRCLTIMVLFATSFPITALASAAPRGPSIHGLEVESEGSVVLADERMIVDCSRDLFRCTVTLRYQLMLADTWANFHCPVDGTNLSWRVDGHDVSESSPRLAHQGEPGPISIEVSYEILGPSRRSGYAISGLEIRHLVLGDRNGEFEGMLPYDSSPIAHADGYHGSIVLMTPAASGIEVGGSLVPDPQTEGHYSRALEAGRNEGSITVRRIAQALSIGGPYLGLGYVDGRSIGGPHFAATAGFELGLGEFLIGGLSAELDATGRFLTALSIEVATFSVLIIPSVSLGIGLPVEWIAGTGQPSGVKAGLRLLAGMVFLSCLEVHGTLDYWPSYGDWVGGVMGRISL